MKRKLKSLIGQVAKQAKDIGKLRDKMDATHEELKQFMEDAEFAQDDLWEAARSLQQAVDQLSKNV